MEVMVVAVSAEYANGLREERVGPAFQEVGSAVMVAELKARWVPKGSDEAVEEVKVVGTEELRSRCRRAALRPTRIPERDLWPRWSQS